MGTVDLRHPDIPGSEMTQPAETAAYFLARGYEVADFAAETAAAEAEAAFKVAAAKAAAEAAVTAKAPAEAADDSASTEGAVAVGLTKK